MRLFFGLPLGPAARQAVANFSDDLRRTGTFGKATWVRPECLHVTMRFLGETTSPILEKLTGWESSLNSSASIPVTFGPLDAFPNLKTPKVLFLRVNPPEPVQAIYRMLESYLAGVGIPDESRPYTPHLTLARIRRPPDRLPTPSRLPPDRLPIPDRLTAVTLFESRLTPSGPVYRHIKNFIFP